MYLDYLSKQLTNDDFSQLRELLKVFGNVFDNINTYQNFLSNNAYLKSLLGKNHFITLVALHKGVVMGGSTAYVL